MKLLCIVVNYQTPSLTTRCVDALLRELEEVKDAQVVVVDNDSQDGSLEALKAAADTNGWGERVSLQDSGHNGGLSYGINSALRPILEARQGPEYVFLLNSDAFVESGAVRVLLEFLDAHPEVGIAGSSSVGEDGVPHHTAFRFHTAWSELAWAARFRPLSMLLEPWVVAPTRPMELGRVDWVFGASMMIRREVFDTIGLFDEEYFLYYEETDFCLRAHRAGWPSWHVPQSRIVHIGGASTQLHERAKPRAQYWFESRRRYFRKNHGLFYLWLSNLLWILGFISWRIRRPLMGKPDDDPPGLLGDFLRNSFGALPETTHSAQARAAGS